MKFTMILSAIALVATVSPIGATPLGVLNGNFTQGANAGSVGCVSLLTCLVGGSGNDTAIGSGPWDGTWAGVASLLAPPTLTISTTGDPLNPADGSAEISGLLAGTGVGGLVDDTGDFFENTGGFLIANQSYTLTADITAGGILSSTVLSNAGVGIELLSGGTVLASGTDGVHLLSVNLISGDTYQEQVQFTTGGVAPVGTVQIELFDDPSKLAAANVLSDVKFSEVGLTLTPEPKDWALVAIGAGLIGLAWIRRRSHSQV